MRTGSLLFALTLAVLGCDGGATNAQQDAGPPDETAPVVTMELGRYDVLSGLVQLPVMATDDVAVVRTELLVDDAVVAESTVEPFPLEWDSTAASDGIHTVVVAAYDGAGNRAVTDAVPALVVNSGQGAEYRDAPDPLAGKFEDYFTVPVSWNGNNEIIDRKYHWTMPAGIGHLVAVLQWDASTGFELNFSSGTGWCPDSGVALAEATESDGEIVLDYAPGTSLDEVDWFVHVGGANAADMKGQEVLFTLRVVLLP